MSHGEAAQKGLEKEKFAFKKERIRAAKIRILKMKERSDPVQ